MQQERKNTEKRTEIQTRKQDYQNQLASLKEEKWKRKLGIWKYEVFAFGPFLLSILSSLIIHNVCVFPKEKNKKEIVECIEKIENTNNFYQTGWYPFNQSDYYFRIFQDNEKDEMWIEFGKEQSEKIYVEKRFRLEQLETELEKMDQTLKKEKNTLIAFLMSMGTLELMLNVPTRKKSKKN